MSESLEIETVSKEIDQLVELARSGDRTAFDRLIVKYQKKIVNLCVRLLGNISDGEDAAQDTFVKAYKNIKQFKGNSRFSTWLYAIAINTCRNSRRTWWSKLWKKAVKLDKPLTDSNGDSVNYELSDVTTLPSKVLTRKRQIALIVEAIKKLPEIHRELVILRDFHERSYEEISEITRIPQGTVKSRLARARAALHQEIKGGFSG